MFDLAVVFSILIGSIFIGVPVAFALCFTAVTSMLIFLGPVHLIQVVSVVISQGTSYNQLIAPSFILMAELLSQGRVAFDIYYVLSKRMQKLKGGLAVAAIAACTVFAALCGSSPATAASIGRTSVKEMTELKYDQRFSVGAVAAGGTLGLLIPPSIQFIMYGIVTETSIVRLFAAGILPGLLLSFMLMVFVIARANMNPSLVGISQTPKSPESVKHDGADQETFMQDMIKIVPPLLLIVGILGSLYSGLATPTEVAAVGAMGALFIVVAMRRLNKSLFFNILRDTTRSSCMIIFTIMSGMLLSYTVSSLGLAAKFSNLILSMVTNKWLIVTSCYVIWLILGCLLDPLSMIVLTMPFMYPLLTACGFDPIWIGVVSTLCVNIGMLTPPVGLNLFVLSSVCKIPMKDVIIGTFPYVFVLIACLIILTIFPGISLFIPNMLF